MAIRLLTESGVKQSAIVFVTVVVCPEVRIHCLSTHRYFRGIASKNGGGGAVVYSALCEGKSWWWWWCLYCCCYCWFLRRVSVL